MRICIISLIYTYPSAGYVQRGTGRYVLHTTEEVDRPRIRGRGSPGRCGGGETLVSDGTVMLSKLNVSSHGMSDVVVICINSGFYRSVGFRYVCITYLDLFTKV